MYLLCLVVITNQYYNIVLLENRYTHCYLLVTINTTGVSIVVDCLTFMLSVKFIQVYPFTYCLTGYLKW